MNNIDIKFLIALSHNKIISIEQIDKDDYSIEFIVHELSDDAIKCFQDIGKTYLIAGNGYITVKINMVLENE